MDGCRSRWDQDLQRYKREEWREDEQSGLEIVSDAVDDKRDHRHRETEHETDRPHPGSGIPDMCAGGFGRRDMSQICGIGSDGISGLPERRLRLFSGCQSADIDSGRMETRRLCYTRLTGHWIDGIARRVERESKIHYIQIAGLRHVDLRSGADRVA